jgi:hypothetical protein
MGPCYLLSSCLVSLGWLTMVGPVPSKVSEWLTDLVLFGGMVCPPSTSPMWGMAGTSCQVLCGIGLDKRSSWRLSLPWVAACEGVWRLVVAVQ